MLLRFSVGGNGCCSEGYGKVFHGEGLTLFGR